MRRGENTKRAQLRRTFRAEAENFWRAISERGTDPKVAERCAWDLARIALRVHLFDEGHRSGRKGARR